MMGARSRWVLTFLLLGAIAVVGGNTWLAFRSVDGLLESEYWVQHTLEVISQVEQIMSLAKDAETGSRGFLITGENNYLEPYTVARRELPAALDRYGAADAGQSGAAGEPGGDAGGGRAADGCCSRRASRCAAGRSQ